AGDISSIDNQTYPKSGVYAVKQGPVLATNIENQINEVDLIPYRPQKHSLAILSTGGKHAVASRSLFCTSGKWVWHLKDYIDRRFMRQYQSHS
ncbi:MAG: bifunctional NADH dehydrogenase FAD-containing subunit/selenide, water dikinase SelD, partial [Betaproteobacteria bacterium]